MSIIGTSRSELVHQAKHFTVEALCSGKTAEAIEQALRVTGRSEQRSSPLQPKLAMWLVLCMPIFRSDSIPAVLARLVNGLRELVTALSLRPVTDGAIAHSRRKLGVEPVKEFYRLQANQIRPAPSFHGLCVWAFDGSLLTMPDTKANRRRFGAVKPSRGRSAFPQMKVVGLQDVASRGLRDVRFDSWKAGERMMALPMLDHLGEGDLVLLDRGFYAAWFFEAIRLQRSHFLCRVSAFVKFDALPETSKESGDYLAFIEAPVELPKKQRYTNSRGIHVKNRTVRMLVRVLEYRIGGFERVRLVTSLLDRSITALDLVLQYHRRWEIELALDELKTHQSSTASGTLKTIFRGLSPRAVMQEAYALVASYNLIRGLIKEASDRHRIDPDKISLVDSLRAVALMAPRMRSAPSHRLPALYNQLLADIAESLIDRPRRGRRYPRVVKQKMSNFKLKRPRHKQVLIDFKSSIRIGA